MFLEHFCGHCRTLNIAWNKHWTMNLLHSYTIWAPNNVLRSNCLREVFHWSGIRFGVLYCAFVQSLQSLQCACYHSVINKICSGEFTMYVQCWMHLVLRSSVHGVLHGTQKCESQGQARESSWRLWLRLMAKSSSHCSQQSKATDDHHNCPLCIVDKYLAQYHCLVYEVWTHSCV